MKKRGIVLLLITAVSFGIIVIFLLQNQSNPIIFKEQTLPFQSSEKNISTPLIPDEKDWTVVDSANQKLNYIKWMKNAKTEMESFGIIPLTGREWVRYVQVNSPDDLDNQGLFAKFTQELTEENGWHTTISSIVSKYGGYTDVVIENHEIIGIPLSPTLGGSSFIKFNENFLVVINYSEYSDDKYLIKQVGSVDYTYPHPREYRIFISEVTPIEDFLSNKILQDMWF